MDEFSTITCRICCLSQIKREVETNDDLALTSKLVFSDENDVKITENPVACNECKVEIDEMCAFVHKEEYVEDAIKSEVIVEEHSVLSNIEESIPVNILYCYECNYRTNDKRNLTDHVFAHRFKCNQCSCTTLDNSMLISHVQMHLVTETLKCSVCNYTCIEINLLDEHMSTHTVSEDVRKYHNEMNQFHVTETTFQRQVEISKCKKCDYSTSKTKYLSQHMRRKHGEGKLKRKNKSKLIDDAGKKVYKCNLCNYRNNFSSNFNAHLLTHSSECPFCCDKCDYKTYNEKYLNSHKRIHSEDKPFKCNSCEFRTKYLTFLKVHSRKHSGEFNFNCDKCDYKTYNKSHLNSHRMVHSDEKPFKCGLCEFSTKNLRSLKDHSKKHSGERNYNCDKCDYKTYIKKYLTAHKKVHAVEKAFKCSLCGFNTKYMRNLKAHTKKHFIGENAITKVQRNVFEGLQNIQRIIRMVAN
ncbi:hypothetical protein FQR65_LT16168 [Abscondita terminalis]|nr:hypothetical protein FQR65_LT16168 [Abscondita terminalis]